MTNTTTTQPYVRVDYVWADGLKGHITFATGVAMNAVVLAHAQLSADASEDPQDDRYGMGFEILRAVREC